MGPIGKQHAETLLKDINGAVLTTIPDGTDARYVDVIAEYPPADILNALNGDGTTPGVMYRAGEILQHDKPALIVLGIGEIAIGKEPKEAGDEGEPIEEFVLVTLEDLAAGLSNHHF